MRGSPLIPLRPVVSTGREGLTGGRVSRQPLPLVGDRVCWWAARKPLCRSGSSFVVLVVEVSLRFQGNPISGRGWKSWVGNIKMLPWVKNKRTADQLVFVSSRSAASNVSQRSKSSLILVRFQNNQKEEMFLKNEVYEPVWVYSINIKLLLFSMKVFLESIIYNPFLFQYVKHFLFF